MPLLKQYELSGVRVLVWKMTETLEVLQGMVSSSLVAQACEEFASEKRRAEWLAVRALLSNCLGVDACVVYDAAGKPSLEGFDGEISISDGIAAGHEISDRLFKVSYSLGRGDFSSVLSNKEPILTAQIKRSISLGGGMDVAKETLSTFSPFA